MKALDMREVEQFVSSNIGVFHDTKLKSLQQLDLRGVLRKKNPYLFKAKNITVASDLITQVLDAYLSSSEEKIFGDFLENLALFIVGKTYDGRKSAATGVDFEFTDEQKIHFLVSVKSGPNWGNSSQQRKLEEDFKKAVQVIKQTDRKRNVQAVLGICYGKTRTTFLRNYQKVVGQNFWYLISGSRNLYTDIIEPLGHNAKRHNERFLAEKGAIVNTFTEEFLGDFCSNGRIDWKKLVEFNSGNLDLT